MPVQLLRLPRKSNRQVLPLRAWLQRPPTPQVVLANLVTLRPKLRCLLAVLVLVPALVRGLGLQLSRNSSRPSCSGMCTSSLYGVPCVAYGMLPLG